MDERAVSTMVSYVLALGISAILIGGLLTAGGTFVDNQRNTVVTSELQVVGQRLAADLATADRLVQLGTGPTDIQVTARLPQTVVGSAYTIDINTANGNVSLELSTRGADQTVTIDVANTTTIASGRVGGGDLDIVYNEGENQLEVSRRD